jgi:transposase
MVRLWILCFNEGGIDALDSKPRPGRPRKIKLQRLRDLLVPVLEDPSKAAQEHWTGGKIHGWLKEQLAMELGYRTTIRYLHELDDNLRVPQRWPERQDEAQRAAFLEELHALQNDPKVELSGLATNAGWKAIPGRAGAGVPGATARACLTWASTSAPTSWAPSVQPPVRASR